MNQYIDSFKLWLQSKNYSASTIRNYVVDVNKYLSQNSVDDVFNPDNLVSYLTSIQKDLNKDRYTSSMSKFLQFAFDQKLISSNPIKNILKNTGNQKKPSSVSIENLISQYQQHLINKNFTPATVKNYINDIQQFISWSKSNP